MHSQERQKICNYCEGRIPLDAVVCLYCSSNQEMSMSEEEEQLRRQQSFQKSLSSLYTPPYSVKSGGYVDSEKREEGMMKQAEGLKIPAGDKKFQTAAPLGAPSIPVDPSSEGMMSDEKTSFWPILWLSMGANLLLLGLLQLFFSDNGILRLEWNSHHWFIYCLLSLPLIFFGYKKVQALPK